MGFKILVAGFTCLFLLTGISAQDTTVKRLTLKECIDNSLENNPLLQVALNREEMTRVMHSITPFLPVARASARQNFSRTESSLTFATGGNREFRDAKSESVSAGLSFTWRLFDGLGMFAAYRKSGINFSLSEIETRETIENLVVNTSNNYYQVLVQQSRVDAALKTLELSRERFRIVQEKLDIGSASGMDLQQARLDFNADSSYLVRQHEALTNLYIGLNRLMNTDISWQSYVSDTISLGTALSLSSLEQAALVNNTSILSSKYLIQYQGANLRQARAARYPSLDFISGYTFSRSESPASVLTFNQAKGLNYGFEASLGIFNGFLVNRNIKNATLELANRRLGYEQARLEVMAELHSLYNIYLNSFTMIEFERQNVSVSRANLDIALERYELGALSGLGFREFQISYLNAVDRSLAAMYQAKVLELSLLVLSGQMDEFFNRIR